MTPLSVIFITPRSDCLMESDSVFQRTSNCRGCAVTVSPKAPGTFELVGPKEASLALLSDCVGAADTVCLGLVAIWIAQIPITTSAAVGNKCDQRIPSGLNPETRGPGGTRGVVRGSWGLDDIAEADAIIGIAAADDDDDADVVADAAAAGAGAGTMCRSSSGSG